VSRRSPRKRIAVAVAPALAAVGILIAAVAGAFAFSPQPFTLLTESRLDVHLAAGGQFDCEDLRGGCPGMSASDGRPGTYSSLAIDTSPDPAASSAPAAAVAAASTGLSACRAGASLRFALHPLDGRRIVRAEILIGGRVAARAALSPSALRRRASLTSIVLPGLAGTARRQVVVETFTSIGHARRTVRTVSGCGALTPPRNVTVHGHMPR
jgi:hypothetical protein